MVGADQTLEALESAWRREPQAVFVRLADAYLNSGAIDRAVTILRDGLSRWPRNLAARVALARVLVEQLELEEAEQELDEVLDREPAHWGAVDLLATLRRRQGDRRGEVAALRSLVAMSPGHRQVERRLRIAQRELEERPAIPLPRPEYVPINPHAVPMVLDRVVPTGPIRLSVNRVLTVPSVRVPDRPSVASVEEAPLGGPLPGVPRSSRPPPAEDPFFNETMVDLLVAQGRFAEARELTMKLAEKRPGRPDIQERLAELRLGAGGGENKVGSKELGELMQGVLAAAATELDALAGPVRPPSVGGDT